MDALLTTIITRPYVFAFLAAYLILSIRRWGWKRSVIWLVSGYLIALLSEYSSINNGVPYGEYHYIYENLKGELLVAGVPFFDSLSYPFLIFAGYTTAEYILAPLLCKEGKGEVDLPHPTSPYKGEVTVILGALLTMLLDVIIDPIATMGDKWFLGKIHWYVHPGYYFGVPLTNFAGWFLVALAVISFNVVLWQPNPPQPPFDKGGGKQLPPFAKGGKGGFNIIYPFFYIAIALFNIAVTFWVGEWELGIASSLIIAAIAATVMRAYRSVPDRRTKGS